MAASLDPERAQACAERMLGTLNESFLAMLISIGQHVVEDGIVNSYFIARLA